MKKIQITGLSVWDFDNRKEAIKFEDWYVEIEHHTQVNPELNKIRDILERVYRAKYQTNVQIHLFTKEH